MDQYGRQTSGPIPDTLHVGHNGTRFQEHEHNSPPDESHFTTSPPMSQYGSQYGSQYDGSQYGGHPYNHDQIVPQYPGSESKEAVDGPTPAMHPDGLGQFGFYHPQPTQPHRSLSPTLSQGSTTVGSPHIGSILSPEDEGKEVYQSHIQPIERGAEPPKKKRICGLPMLIFWGLLALLVLLVVGLAVGLGVGLGIKHKSNKATPTSASNSTSTNSTSAPKFSGDPNYSIGGYIDPSYYSQKGAFNGSGIAFAGVQAQNLIFVFFQHWTGDIRFMQLTQDGSWKGGSKSETVATDAKNSTPISTVAYSINGTSKWHVFYINQDGYIRQRTNSNATALWEDGSLNSANLKALDADTVGLQACWYGNFYGDTDFTKFPTSTGQKNTEAYDPDYGMHLWYPSDNTTFQQYGFFEGQENWTFQKTWPGLNGHAGVGCYSWLPGSVSYAMFVNLQNSVEIWWKDTNSSLPSKDSHPINSWNNASQAAIPNVHPSTALGYTTFFMAQSADRYVHGYNISFMAENTTYSQQDTITVSDPTGPVQGLGGSHATISAVQSKSGGANLYVFFQTEGDDITFFNRDLTGGPWSSGKLPIPAK